ncbi:septum formation family protein [Pseudofrankia inefficax]|uniref:septum formation family protein n=1 Tax=Pseudofrankia inefficax (strain DSM 45817 / CECT 9037 / DDB 130130 / EuI1c) TaxID=298654 RepID=UPI0003253CF1|nr:septum formation family protein [Pseudofrankia inefficax]
MTDDVAEDPDAPGEPRPGRARRARKGQDDDPFADLVLDESFVKGASVYEAPARTRAAVRRYSADGPATSGTRRRTRRTKTPAPATSPRDWSPAEEPRSRRRGRLLIGVGTVLVLVLGAGYLLFGDVLHHSPRSAPAAAATPAGTLTASPTAATDPPAELADRAYQRGHCYLWDQTADLARVDEVTCDSPHLFEAAADGTVSIADEFPLRAGYPTEDQWQDIEKRYCLATVEKFLGYPLDPHGRFHNGAIRPAEDSWQAGRRVLHCGLNGSVPGQVVTNGDQQLFSGKIEGADQAWVYPVGTCVSAPDASQTTHVVPCAEPHRSVAIGTGRLPDTPDGAPPSLASFVQQAAARCAAVARGALGQSFRETTTERIGFYPIDPESWRAGTREFTCTIDYTTAANQPRTVTGDQLHPAQGVLA